MDYSFCAEILCMTEHEMYVVISEITPSQLKNFFELCKEWNLVKCNYKKVSPVLQLAGKHYAKKDSTNLTKEQYIILLQFIDDHKISAEPQNRGYEFEQSWGFRDPRDYWPTLQMYIKDKFYEIFDEFIHNYSIPIEIEINGEKIKEFIDYESVLEQFVIPANCDLEETHFSQFLIINKNLIEKNYFTAEQLKIIYANKNGKNLLPDVELINRNEIQVSYAPIMSKNLYLEKFQKQFIENGKYNPSALNNYKIKFEQKNHKVYGTSIPETKMFIASNSKIYKVQFNTLLHDAEVSMQDFMQNYGPCVYSPKKIYRLMTM